MHQPQRDTTTASSTDASPPTRLEAPSPIDDFSQCHVGILGRLDALAELPAQVAAATQARHTAAELLPFFSEVVFEHHQQEEQELFPAVLASAQAGDERDLVQAVIEQLVTEHRDIEARWRQLAPALKAVAKGREVVLDGPALTDLVARYRAHAAFEEKHFLPLSQRILGRNSLHLAALGMSLHIRQHMPAVLQRFGNRI